VEGLNGAFLAPVGCGNSDTHRDLADCSGITFTHPAAKLDPIAGETASERQSSCRCFQKNQHTPLRIASGTTIDATMTNAVA
jgi:hypothetical protein